jgi:ketosteroid isomerase-like protein
LSYGHSNGLIENQDAFIKTLISGKSVFLTIDLSDQTIDMVDKTAIVRHTLYAKTNNDGVLGEVKLKVLMIFQKENGSWKLLARQAVKIPV